jgi:hypothetical protein
MTGRKTHRLCAARCIFSGQNTSSLGKRLPAKLMTRDRLSRALIIQAIITSRNTVPEI